MIELSVANTDASGPETAKVRSGKGFSALIGGDGTVWTWGENDYGQLGLGDTVQRSTPTRVTSLGTVVDIALGDRHALAIKSDGTVWAWGDHRKGQLGIGSILSGARLAPVRLERLDNFSAAPVQVESGEKNSIILMSDGQALTFGDNINGQLGRTVDPNLSAHFYPHSVEDLPVGVTEVGINPFIGTALKDDGSVWTWGDARYIGRGYFDSAAEIPPYIPGPITTGVDGGVFYGAVRLGRLLSFLTVDGAIYEWQSYEYAGAIERRVDGLPVFASFSRSPAAAFYVGITPDGSVWAWGSNLYGELGQGDTEPHAPSVVELPATAISISAGAHHSLVVTSDCALWAWGENASYNLGDGTDVLRASPVRVLTSDASSFDACAPAGEENTEPPSPTPMPGRNPPDPNAPDPNAPDPNAPVPGEQPPTVKPMPRPITSSCKSTMDGPASCNFVVDPLPGSDFPKPGDVVAPDFSTPDFSTPDFAPMPVIDVNFPEMPPIGCNLPDFTNMSDCPPVPGTGGPLPGGRDRRGKRGINPNIKTGGKTHGKRRKVFPGPKHSGPHKRCFPAGASCMGAITELLMGVGISPLDIVFQIGPEWDKQLRREKCFRRGVSRLDAAAWFASKLMCRIIDEGPPTHNVYIGPPHHRPGQKTWTFDEHFDLFAVSHSSTSEGSYHAVEVFGDHFREPYPISLVENPFASPDESEILQIEVGPDYTRREAERLAAFRAAALRRSSVSVQASVPYSEEYMMRDRMILRAPDRGFQETYLIYGKQSDLSPEGRIHILTGVLPATAREMEQFPKVT